MSLTTGDQAALEMGVLFNRPRQRKRAPALIAMLRTRIEGRRANGYRDIVMKLTDAERVLALAELAPAEDLGDMG